MKHSDDTTSGGEAEPLRRLFVALLPEAPVRDELVRRQRLLLPHIARAKLTARANLHLTLAFLGMLTEEKSASALDAMSSAAHAFVVDGRMDCDIAPDGPTGALTLTLDGIGHFDKRGGSVLWQGIAEDEGRERLERLQALLVVSLREHGLSLEERTYVPHITLARGVRFRYGEQIGDNVCAASIDDLVSQVNVRIGKSRKEITTMRAGALSLMWSHHPEGGELTYSELARVPLA